MDTDRFVEFCSTVVLVGMIAILAVPRFGVSGVTDVLLTAAAVALVFGVPFAAFLVYVIDASGSHLGPWGPEDVVFFAAVAPPAFGTMWAAEELGLEGVVYGVAVAVGLLTSILFAVVVRDATVGEWPPGSSARERSGGGPPGGR
jgi:H+/gluconate symporter-like permease